MTLRSFIDNTGSPDRTIAVVADDTGGPFEDMLAEAFPDQQIGVERTEASAIGTDLAPEIDDALAAAGDTAVLLEDGEPIAASPMDELYDAILAINSDLFVTGARGVGEIEFPDVLAGLEGTRLRLRGYPLAHKEKLLLIVVSRYIEQRAWAAGRGTLYSAFQRLSRIDDEIGTYETYAKLAETDVDVHVYGIDDGCPPELGTTIHTGTGPEYRDGWFVIYDPDDRTAPDAVGTALVCLETEPRVWDAVWTTEPDRVARIEDYVAREL
ncbi:histidine kinase [Natrinema saccharevitans]|uniref:Histidine kinase n=1 Tax=Natrinema saccharevitans TaxID=301967 RepID=A0A1S8AUC8_9EURY|nr:DICT sensory domain-containing protein [Natrinema saccharevitans]OLZ40187.1 histidine kinase [Natrinema saccharevitans]